ncbi:hypothetical protein BDV59DRAFT_44421 [Aspergillus ambiguus]|uniref:uncharacterized protein n=1 Tax=Aspergillus ambiguus TaxID=176160 RepID=UPI003CCD842B
MQAPPPTPTSGYISLSSSPPPERNQCIPNSLPTLAMMLNGGVATMNHINDALMEHLNNDRVLERFQSITIAESADEINEKADVYHRNPPNGDDNKEDESPQTPSTEQSTPTENPHPVIEEGTRDAPVRHRRSYSTSTIDAMAIRPLSSPPMNTEVARVLQLSDAEMRRSGRHRR